MKSILSFVFFIAFAVTVSFAQSEAAVKTETKACCKGPAAASSCSKGSASATTSETGTVNAVSATEKGAKSCCSKGSASACKGGKSSASVNEESATPTKAVRRVTHAGAKNKAARASKE